MKARYIYEGQAIDYAPSLDQHFDLKQFDEENKWNYEVFPNQEKEPVITKASRWFGSIIDGDTLLQMVEAFNEAIINFTPSENQRAAMRTILEKEKEMQRLGAEFRTKTVNLMFERSKEKMVRQWDQHANQEIKKLENQLDGQFDSLTNTPESAE